MEIFARYGLFFSKGDPERALKIRQFHERLRITDDGPAMVQIYDTCTHFIRTIPLLQADKHNIEDVDTTLEDHIYDEVCHIFMARPIRPKVAVPQKGSYEKRIDSLYKGSADSYERDAIWEQNTTMAILQPGDRDFDAEPLEDGRLFSTTGD
jgi:hypothetical protein